MRLFDKLRGKDKKPTEPEKPKDLGKLLAELQSDDEETRVRAAEELGKLRDKGAANPLILRLQDESWKVREKAARALGYIADEKITESLVQFLIESLTDNRVEVRRSAADAISSMIKYDLSGQNQQHAINLIIKTLGREDPEFCRRIEYTLWNIGTPTVIQLAKALKSEDWRVRMNAAIALGHTNCQRTSDPYGILLDPSAIFCLDTQIYDRNRRDVAMAVNPLIEALGDSEPKVRKYATYALGRIETAKAVKPLETMLADKDVEVRREAEEALQRIRKNNAEAWALDLEEKKDYRTLAAIFNSMDFEDRLHWDKQTYAGNALKRIGLEAVDAIIEETAKDGVGAHKLSGLLIDMNATKAVPLLKKLADRGRFDAYGMTRAVKEFVAKYPELQMADEMVKCALCGKSRPTSEMRGGGEPYFCSDTCWNKRGRLIGSKFYGALNCPYYSEGMCMVSGENTCSLGFGSYDTTCYVYKIGKTRRF